MPQKNHFCHAIANAYKNGARNNNKQRNLTSLEKRIMESVKRDDDIIASERQGDTLLPFLNPKTGRVINIADLNPLVMY
jgi:hypothetical protein